MAHAAKNPFVVDVRDLVHKPGRMDQRQVDAPARERFGEALAAVPAGAPIEIDVRLESVHEGILATGVAVMTADAECSRCLRAFTIPLEVDFVELFAYAQSEDSDYQVVDEIVDLEPVIRDAAVLALPFQPVDRPDCAGLDPETGERLEPGADQKPVEHIDPRWAALEGFQTDNDGADQRQ